MKDKVLLVAEGETIECRQLANSRDQTVLLKSEECAYRLAVLSGRCTGEKKTRP